MPLKAAASRGGDNLSIKMSFGRRQIRSTRPAPPLRRAKTPSPFHALKVLLLAVGYLSPTAVRGFSVSVENAPCVRLFHAHGDVGCRAPDRGGVTKPLLLVDSEQQMERIERLSVTRFLEKTRGNEARVAGTVSDSDAVEDRFGFIAVVPEALFNRTSLDRLSSTGLLGGVLVLEEESVGVSVTAAAAVGRGLYSPDVSTPQGKSTPTADFDVDASYEWNSQGDGFLMESLNYPVVLVTGDSKESIRERAASNGDIGSSSWGQYPQHKAKMTFYFGGSGTDLNSQACLSWTDIDGNRSPQCLPLGGQSSWASIGPPGFAKKEAVFAISGMDSTSLFHDRAPGANSAVSGLVALLAAAESLGAAGRSGEISFADLPRQIVFAAFQTETYGFTGSRRFVKDWREGIDCRNTLKGSEAPDGREACLDPLYPSLEFLNLGRPAHVLSVDQVGCLPESTLWIHPSPGASAAHMGIISGVSLRNEGGVSVANATRSELPPTPLTTFVKADSRQSGFVISGYDEAFSCPYYHDRRDTRATVEASSVVAASELLAKSIFLLAGGTEADAETLSVNATLVETLLDCLLEDWTCEAVREYVVGELANIEETLGFRVSVDASFPPSLYRGPLEFHNGGGLPTVRHTKDDGSWRLHPSWSDDFDSDHDKIQLVPSLLEIFCRAFLSEQASSAYVGGYGTSACRSSGDCPSAECSHGDGSLGRSECVRGHCSCPSGFYHIALGIGLEREEKINEYRVVSDALEKGAPLWTEVNWRKIGVEVYLDPGSSIGNVAFGVGAAVTAAAGFGSWLTFKSLSKLKLL